MHLTLISVGKAGRGPESDLVDDYVDRARKTGRALGFRSFKLIEVASGGGLSEEGARLISKIPPDAKVFRLDENGKQWTSKAFASRLAKWRDQGRPNLTFLIGGAEGYSNAVRKAYPNTIAFGPQTWPHRLVKVMLCEQVYRATSILAGSPYHKA